MNSPSYPSPQGEGGQTSYFCSSTVLPNLDHFLLSLEPNVQECDATEV